MNTQTYEVFIKELTLPEDVYELICIELDKGECYE